MVVYEGKVAVITGGASGVGRSLAFEFGRRGAKVLIADVDRDALEQTAAELRAAGVEATAAICDVTSQASCNELVNKAFENLGGAHFVFANAGVGAGEAGPMWEFSKKDWQWAFNVNVWGVVNTMNAFLPELIRQNEEAHFVVTGSGNGAFIVYPDQPIYTATKAAVQAITENLYYQVSGMETPVQVHALFPGPNVVETGIFNSDRVRPDEMTREAELPESPIHSVEEMKELMGQLGMDLETTHPDEVAKIALEGIEDGQFWILPLNPDSEVKIQRRWESILKRQNPAAPNVG